MIQVNVFLSLPSKLSIFSRERSKPWENMLASPLLCISQKRVICIGNSMICSDIWHKYHEWYFEIVIGEWNLRQFWNITSGIYAKYHAQIMLLFVYTTTHKRFVIFTCRYFKLSWNTTALSQSNCRNFSCSGITARIIFFELINEIQQNLSLFCLEHQTTKTLTLDNKINYSKLTRVQWKQILELAFYKQDYNKKLRVFL